MTREEAVEVLKERYLTCVGIGLDNHANRVNEALDMAIEALSEERTGEWIGLDECSVCGKQAYDFIEGCVEGVEYLPNYCPNCRAKMKVGTGKERVDGTDAD